MVRVYLSRRWQFLSFRKLDTFTREDKAAPRGAGLSEQEVAILIIGNLTHLHLRTKPRRVVRVYLSRRWQFLAFWKLHTFALENKAAPRGAVLLSRKWQFLSFWKRDTFALEDKAVPRGAGLSEGGGGNSYHWKLDNLTLEDTRKVLKKINF